MAASGLVDQLTPEASLIRLEEAVRRFWKRHDVPGAVRAGRSDGPSLVIYPQPLTADMSRGDQVCLLATADLLARYRTMRGASVRQRVGWASHGLAVEVAVERSLGPEVAGLEEAAFRDACRERALAEAAEGERLVDDLGLWLEADDVYVTLSPRVVGMVWGALHRLWRAGQLRQEPRVVPFCPRCATPLSVAEAAHKTAPAESLMTWLILPWEEDPGAYLLVSTPAPWMLVGMVALAAHANASYVLVTVRRQDGAPQRLLLAEAALRRLPASEYQVVRRLPAKSLRGVRYHPPFTFLPAGEQIGRVVLSDDVPLAEGSGLVPVTPAFEARSLALAMDRDLAVPELLDAWGRFDEGVTPWQGLNPPDVAPLVVENLRARGLLFRVEKAPASRSLCPHCETPLLPLARRVWLAETGSGPWILSRSRSWGAPLPIWICDGCGHTVCLAGLDDLAHQAGVEASQIDPHRPEIDRLSWPCERCGRTMRRVPEVVDARLEAAVVPWGAGLAGQPATGSLAVSLGQGQPGWLSEAADMAALLRTSPAWEQAIALPEGSEWPARELEHSRPADAQRWAAYAGGTPEEAEEAFLRPLWSLAAAGGVPTPTPAGGGAAAVGELLERWLRARLHQATRLVGEALDAADPGRAAGHLALFASDVGDWFLPHHPGGRLPAGPVADQMLTTLGRLLAPFAPHLAEAIFHHTAGRRLDGVRGARSSVHLAAWPVPPSIWQDEALLSRMALVQRLVALGRTARATAGLEADQPLRQALIGLEDEAAALWLGRGVLQALLAEALAVERPEVLPDASARIAWHLSLAPDRDPAREVPPAAIAEALAALDAPQAAALARQLREGLSISLQVGGQAITLLPDEVQVRPRAQPGWVAAADGELVVGLKVE